MKIVLKYFVSPSLAVFGSVEQTLFGEIFSWSGRVLSWSDRFEVPQIDIGLSQTFIHWQFGYVSNIYCSNVSPVKIGNSPLSSFRIFSIKSASSNGAAIYNAFS